MKRLIIIAFLFFSFLYAGGVDIPRQGLTAYYTMSEEDLTVSDNVISEPDFNVDSSGGADTPEWVITTQIEISGSQLIYDGSGLGYILQRNVDLVWGEEYIMEIKVDSVASGKKCKISLPVVRELDVGINRTTYTCDAYPQQNTQIYFYNNGNGGACRIDYVYIYAVNGAVSDRSGNGNHADIAVTPPTFSTDVNGADGEAISCRDNYMDTGIDFGGLSSYSISAWVKRPDEGIQPRTYIAQKNATADTTVIYIYFAFNDYLYFSGARGGGVYELIPNITEWNHYVLIYDGSGSGDLGKHFLYLNGELQTWDGNGSGDALTSTPDIGGSIQIGKVGDSDYNYKGEFSDVAFYPSEILTSDEATQLYQAGLVSGKYNLKPASQYPQLQWEVNPVRLSAGEATDELDLIDLTGESGSVTVGGEDYKIITTVEEFKGIGDSLSLNYILANDLDFTGEGDGWVELGDHTGKLNGNGYVISNVVFPDTVRSMFTKITRVTNLGVEDCSNITQYYAPTGGNMHTILSYDAYENETSVERCYFKDCSLDCDGELGGQTVGIILGRAVGTTIKDTYILNGYVYSSNNYKGFFIGRGSGSSQNNTFENCYVVGDMPNTSFSHVFCGRYDSDFDGDNFYDTEYGTVPGIDDSGEGTGTAYGKTTAEMQDPDTYSSWDLDDVWYMPEESIPGKINAKGIDRNGLVAYYPLSEEELTYSSNLFANSTFDSDTYWTLRSNTISDGCLNIFQPSTYCNETKSVTDGNTYYLQYEVVANDSDRGLQFILGSIAASGLRSVSRSVGVHTYILECGTTASSIGFRSVTATSDTLKIDNVYLYEVNGAVTDKSGNGNHGDIAVIPPTFGSDQSGRNNKAMSFDGENDKVTIADNSLWDLGSGGVTIAFWMKLDNSFTSSDTTSQTILAKYTSDSYNASIFLVGTEIPTSNTQKGSICFTIDDNGAGVGYFYSNTANRSWVADTWYHIAFTRNESSVKAYINGVDNSASYFGSGSGSLTDIGGDIEVGGGTIEGGGWSSTRYFDGDLDKLAIYNRALSADEVLDLMNNTK